MKKTNFFKFVALFAMGLSIAMFSSCSSDGGDGPGAPAPGPGGGNPVFTIQGANFINQDIPAGTADLIGDVSINSSAINGGSTLLTFASSEELKSAYIGLAGTKGYYECDLRSARVLVKSAGLQQAGARTFIYEILLLLNQTLNCENFSICIVGVTLSGDRSALADTEPIEVIEVGTGKLQVSLSWDQFDDVDLHLFEPDGNEVCYWNPISSDDVDYNKIMFDFYVYLVNKHTSHNASGLRYPDDMMTLYGYYMNIPDTVDENAEYENFMRGQNFKMYGELDLDSNPSCDIDGVNNENITYATNVKQGTYRVAVDLYEKCDYVKPGAKYSVTVRYNGQVVWAKTGQFDDNDGGNYDEPSGHVTVGTFTISGSTARANVQASEAAPAAEINPLMKEIAQKLFKK